MTILQPPNKRLMVALGAGVVSHLTHGIWQSGSHAVFYLMLAIWAYAEVTDGAGWFRKALGAAVMLYLVMDLARNLIRY